MHICEELSIGRIRFTGEWYTYMEAAFAGE